MADAEHATRTAFPVTEEGRSSFKLIVELASFLGSIGFVTSALVSEFVFRHFGLSYLAIASAQDIALGAVRILILAVPAFIAAAMFLIVGGFFVMLLGTWLRLARTSLRGKVGLALFISITTGSVTAVYQALAFAGPSGAVIVTSFASLFILLIVQTLVAVFLGIVVEPLKIGELTSFRRKMIVSGAGAFSLCSVGIAVDNSLRKDFDMGVGRLIQPAALPPRLMAQGNCDGRRVVWLGSDRALVSCGRRYFLMSDQSKLMMLLR